MEDNSTQEKEIEQKIVFNEALEYFERNGILEPIDDQNTQPINVLSNILRDQMLFELDNLKEIIGNNPDLKVESLNDNEKAFFQEFLNYYSTCPICNQKNHSFNLKKLYFNENERLIEDLLKFMNFKNKKLQKFNLKFGIPCCNCFKKYFMEE